MHGLGLKKMNGHCAFQLLGSMLLAVSASQDAAMNIPDKVKDLGLALFLHQISICGMTNYLNDTGPYTLLAPTNDAMKRILSSGGPVLEAKELTQIIELYISRGANRFESLSNEFLLITASTEFPYVRVNLYHQGKTEVQVATVQCVPIDLGKVNQKASNGLIHTLNSIIFPPSGTVMQYLESYKDQFSTLISLLKETGMDFIMKSPGPYTLFAPTNDAFNKLSSGTLDNLRNDVPSLISVLKLHIVAGTYCSAGIISGDVVTAQSLGVTLTKDSSGITVQNAKVIYLDGSVTNGVVHHIDQVIQDGNPIESGRNTVKRLFPIVFI